MEFPPPEAHRLAMFDGAEVQRWPDPEPLPPEGQAQLDRFLALPPDALRPAARHVFAYYKDTVEILGVDGWTDHPLPVIENEEGVWAHVTPIAISICEGSHSDDAWFISIEANVPWEVEHGLDLVWRAGQDVVKVGRVDGHVTNADAYGDERLKDVVYRAQNDKWTTMRDG